MFEGRKGLALAGLFAVTLGVSAPMQAQYLEEFEAVPRWSSSHRAQWGDSATFVAAPDSISGNALHAARAASGSSVRTLKLVLEPGERYQLSVFMRCTVGSADHWAEFGFRLGDFPASDFDENGGAWSLLNKCSNAKGSTGEWQALSASFSSGSARGLTLGFKLGSNGGGSFVAFDRLRLDKTSSPAPPELEVSTRTIRRSVTAGTSAEASFSVRNAGGGDLNFTIESNAAWIQPSPTSGTSRGESRPVRLSLDATSLAPGTHRARLLVSSPEATPSEVEISVELLVEADGGAEFLFPAFHIEELQRHFDLYHERSECIYQGDGRWAALETNLSHPLLRDSSRRAIGYMRISSVRPEPIYEERARAALDYLLTEQRSDGHFTWWNTPSGTDDRFDTQYVTGTVAFALAEGYERFGDERYLRASEAAARWEANAEIGWNTNYVAFAMWHLAKHYGLTGNRRWLDAALEKFHGAIVPRRGGDGSFGEGPGVPPDLVGHNKRVWYHGIILRALVELYRVLPAEHGAREDVRQTIERAVARSLDMQRSSGEIPVGTNVPNEHRDAFILEALLLADLHLGLDTRDAVRGIVNWRLSLDRGVPQEVGFNIDVQSLGLLFEQYAHVVPDPPELPRPRLARTVPRNLDFEADGGFFRLASNWYSFGYGKREGFTESGHGWVQGLADFPEGGEMGVYQIVSVEPGHTYRLTADARTTGGRLGASVGLAGAETHDCHAARFSSEVTSGDWSSVSVELTANSPVMTLFLKARNLDPFRISFDRVLFDNVRLERLGSPPSPAIGVSPERIRAETNVGEDAAASAVQVRNVGGGELRYRLETNVSWLELDPTRGESRGETDLIELRFLSAGLPAGVHTAEVRVIDEEGHSADETLAVELEVRAEGEPPRAVLSESFDNRPTWRSGFDAAWGGAASWLSGLSGESETDGGGGSPSPRAMVVRRDDGGSSSRTLEFELQPNRDYELLIWMKSEAFASNYWAEVAFRLGSHDARSFDEQAQHWRLVRKFSLAGENGNQNRWMQYRASFNSAQNSIITVGFKLGSTGRAPEIAIDELLIRERP